MSKCIRCGEEGPHYVPASFGETGFFMCDPNDRPKPSRTPEFYTMECVFCSKPILPGQTWKDMKYGQFAHENCELVSNIGG